MKFKYTLLLLPLSMILLSACSSNPQPTTETPEQVESYPDIATSPAFTPTSNSYTLQEVAQHASETDCWMAIEGKVYDVTKFVSQHPGGKAIVNGCGKDATELFNERPSNNMGPHPDQARQALANFEIGTLVQ